MLERMLVWLNLILCPLSNINQIQLHLFWIVQKIALSRSREKISVDGIGLFQVQKGFKLRTMLCCIFRGKEYI